ncbi:hypothetical protein [Pseudonocardia sp. H11422]|uniref:hypothetical protein n=1 Tax=Pseudonocardia sp. H11422 TaxID=2835866 RepID=UPI0039775047
MALARALVREPAVFLLDEPLSNLDAKLRATARDELKRFQQEIGTTTIYVTHDQTEAMGLGDRIAIMSGGPTPPRRSRRATPPRWRAPPGPTGRQRGPQTARPSPADRTISVPFTAMEQVTHAVASGQTAITLARSATAVGADADHV